MPVRQNQDNQRRVRKAGETQKNGGNPGKLTPDIVSYSSLLVVYCLLFPLLTACASTPPVVKIGLVAPFEGRHRPIGYDVIYSARLAVREINGAGGIEGRYIALQALDDGGDVQLAQATAQSLVIDQAVVAVIGHWLAETTDAAAPIYSTAALPLLQPGPPTDPSTLDAAFRWRYETVTPFDEIAGPYSGPAYEAMQQLFQAIAAAQQQDGVINRATVGRHLRQ